MRPIQSTRRSKRPADRTRGIQPIDNLVTTEEQRMIENQASQNPHRTHTRQSNMNSSMYEEEEMGEVSVEEIKQANADKMSVLVGQLLAKNKINAKNAFEVPLILINETCAFSETSNDSSWKRLSSTLQSNNRLYGYRVDATHNYTYRVLESITRQEKQDGEERQEENGYRRERPELNSLNSQFVCHEVNECYSKYLEKNYRNINIQHLETFFNVNPVLEKTKRIFDQNGLRALMLNNLDIRTDLSLRITLIQQTNQEEIKNSESEVQILCDLECGPTLQGYNIFRKIENICIINNLIERDDKFTVKRETGEIEALWMEFEAEFINKNRNKMAKVQDQRKETIQAELFVSVIDLQSNGERIYGSDSQMMLNTKEQANGNIHSERIASQDVANQNLPSINNQINQNSSIQDPNNNVNDGNTNELPQIRVLYQNNFPNTSHNTSDDLSSRSNQPNGHVQSNNRAQISNYIKINKLSLSTDLVLREITDFDKEQGENGDLVSKWKKNQKLPPKQRKPRKIKPRTSPQFNFLDYKEGILPKKQNILKIDKQKRKQMKKILKNLHLEAYSQSNCLVNTSQWKIKFELKTLLNQYYERKVDAILNGQDADFNQSLFNTSGPLVIDLEASGQGKWSLIRNCKNASIRQAKEIIKNVIESSNQKEICFAEIYGSFMQCESYISPALCFLTVLHLANECNYSLVQAEGEFNFIIIK